MKTPIRLAFVLTAIAAAIAGGRVLAAQPAHAHRVGAVERNSSSSIIRGTPVIEVFQTLGAPSEKLGRDVWLYRRFHAGTAQAPKDDCDILVITFADGCVSELQLVNQPAVTILAQRAEAKKNVGLYAAATK